jgi:hypothetical protein
MSAPATPNARNRENLFAVPLLREHVTAGKSEWIE